MSRKRESFWFINKHTIKHALSAFENLIVPQWESEAERGRLSAEKWEPLRLRALKRDDYRCCNCHKRKKLDIHHIVPVTAGGRNTLSNLVSLCRECHASIHSWLEKHP